MRLWKFWMRRRINGKSEKDREHRSHGSPSIVAALDCLSRTPVTMTIGSIIVIVTLTGIVHFMDQSSPAAQHISTQPMIQ